MVALGVNYFTNLFCFVGTNKNADNVNEFILTLVDSNTNNILTMLPSKDEISNAIFNLNKSNATGPYNFGGVFYHSYCDVVGKDVCEAVTEFFNTGWMLPNFNESKFA